jgi:hypothetical protein
MVGNGSLQRFPLDRNVAACFAAVVSVARVIFQACPRHPRGLDASAGNCDSQLRRLLHKGLLLPFFLPLLSFTCLKTVNLDARGDLDPFASD